MMRKIAVDCIYAYEFRLLEERTRTPEPVEEPIRPARKSETVLLNKPLKSGRRKIEMKTEEYERRRAELQDLLPELFENENEAPLTAPLPEPKPFNVDEFIVNFCESTGIIGEGTFEEDKLRTQPDFEEYLRPVVIGVIENVEKIDAEIGANSMGWSIDRINKIELAILRVATYEILFMGDKIPYQVAVNEAVERAKTENENSRAYVNGVLAGIIKKNNIA